MSFQKKYPLLILETLFVVPACAFASAFFLNGAMLPLPLMALVFAFWILNITSVVTYFHEEVRGVATYPLLSGIVGEKIRHDFLPRLGNLPYSVSKVSQLYFHKVIHILQNLRANERLLQFREVYIASPSSRARILLQPAAAYSLIILGFANLF